MLKICWGIWNRHCDKVLLSGITTGHKGKFLVTRFYVSTMRDRLFSSGTDGDKGYIIILFGAILIFHQSIEHMVTNLLR